MPKIEDLIALRASVDPTFKVEKDPYTGVFHMEDQILFKFDPGTPEQNILESVLHYVNASNAILKSRGIPKEASLSNLSVKTDGTVIAYGTDMRVVVRGNGGTTNPPPPPPPGTRALEIKYDSVLLVVGFKSDLSLTETVLPESQLLF
ncbi:hypothetical protein [Spirosoma gilvum]